MVRIVWIVAVDLLNLFAAVDARQEQQFFGGLVSELLPDLFDGPLDVNELFFREVTHNVEHGEVGVVDRLVRTAGASMWRFEALA